MDRFLSTDLFKKSSCQSSNGGQVQSSTRLLQLENGGSVAQKSVFALRTLHSRKKRTAPPVPPPPPPLFNTHPLPYTRSAGLLSINSKRWWRNKPPSSPPCLGVVLEKGGNAQKPQLRETGKSRAASEQNSGSRGKSRPEEISPHQRGVIFPLWRFHKF